jgi:tRNA wybutosine-synthesizing protein 1
MNALKKKQLENQGYRLVGNHSAVKVCEWTKKALRKENVCYKCDFYGIKSWRCIQMTPSLTACAHRCVWCWRDISHTEPKWQGKAESPEKIIDGCIQAHKKLLYGFGGNEKANKKRYSEAMQPMHFAISLSGEPTMYPKLPQLVDSLKKRGITSFIVTNGTHPEMLKKLIKHQPTQLYLTLPAPDEKTYKKSCAPLIKGSWKKILQSLKLLKKFRRSAIRLTLAREINLIDPEGYANLIKLANPNFVELKAYMAVGYSQKRLGYKFMPLHKEILEFAKKVANASGLKIIKQKKESRVVLLMKKDCKSRKLKLPE